MRPELAVTAAVALLAAACSEAPEPLGDAGTSPPARAAMIAHSAEFEQRVYEVTAGVHQAVGFGLANSMLVVGDSCAFVIDVMGSVEAASRVNEAFARVTDKPIRAFIYTHNHADHVFGGAGFASDGELAVYAHETTEYYIDRVVNVVRPVLTARSARMFGTALPADGPDAVINAGIGPHLEITHDSGTLGLLRPTRTIADRLHTEICGVEVEMRHAPGETPDQIFVWLPANKVLFPGDNVYKAFPNLYTIRGTPYRDVNAWVASIDRMRDLGAEYLVPSHTRFVSGSEQIGEILTAYRDAIQFVHDQTVRGMNSGMSPDEIVAAVRLPPHLRDHPWLRELYGTVAWSVRSIFDGYLGWFNGDAASLDPLPPGDRAMAMLELAGGRDALLAAARDALAAGRVPFAAELAGYAMRIDEDDEEARLLRAGALRRLAAQSPSPNGRHYYLSRALVLSGDIEEAPERGLDERVRSLLLSVPIANFMAAMPARLDPDRSAEVDVVVGFRFADIDEGYGIHVRRGVAEFRRRFPADCDISVTVSSTQWRRIVLGDRNVAAALASGDLEVEGGVVELVSFLRMFR